MTVRPVSDCHAASLEEAGRNVTYWVCRVCVQPCEATTDGIEATGAGAALAHNLACHAPVVKRERANISA